MSFILPSLGLCNLGKGSYTEREEKIMKGHRRSKGPMDANFILRLFKMAPEEVFIGKANSCSLLLEQQVLDFVFSLLVTIV